MGDRWLTHALILGIDGNDILQKKECWNKDISVT